MSSFRNGAAGEPTMRSYGVFSRTTIQIFPTAGMAAVAAAVGPARLGGATLRDPVGPAPHAVVASATAAIRARWPR
jgi:hypothetical protein